MNLNQKPNANMLISSSVFHNVAVLLLLYLYLSIFFIFLSWLGSTCPVHGTYVLLHRSTPLSLCIYFSRRAGVYELLQCVQGHLCSRGSVVIIDVPVLSSVCVFIALMAYSSRVPLQATTDLLGEWILEALQCFDKVKGGLWVIHMI